jgi:peptidyl-prolyl cis-trans isomerase SurA
MTVLRKSLAAGVLGLALGGVHARAEVIDEIVAKVNDDVITKSDLDTEEQGMLQDLYRRHSGTELDAQVAQAKKELLRRMIDNRVLGQRAAHIFDVAKMQDFYLEQFKNQQNIKSDKKLVETFSPQQVVHAEVSDRIAVSEKDERAYYDAHTAEFEIPAEATVREIVLKASSADRDAKRAQAETIRAKAAEPGADFTAMASELSDAGTKAAGGLLGTVKKGDLAAPLESAAFTIPVGTVSQVIEAEYGFHILKVDARTDAEVKPFDDVKADIESKIENERFAVEYKKYMIKAWSEATIWISPKYQDRLSPIDASN